MFWMKKVMTAAVVAVLVLGAGVLALGTANHSENTASATEPPGSGAPPAPAEEPDAMKRLEKRLADLEKQKALLDATFEDLRTEKLKLEDAKKEKAAAAAAVELGTDLILVVSKSSDGKPPYTYTLREVAAGKIGELSSSDLDVVATYLSRAFQDPKGPKKLRLHTDRGDDPQHKNKVFTACANAGYTKVVVFERVWIVYTMPAPQIHTTPRTVQRIETKELDLTKFAEPKKQ